MRHININKNVDIYMLPAEKFKTFSVSFHFLTELKSETITKNAILPFILKLGSKKYPDMLTINRKLQELYGGIFDCRVRKRGDLHLIEFSFEFLAPSYSDEGQLDNCIDFMKEVLLNPLTKNDSFDNKILDREKENLIDYINGIINDKREYTSVRLTEEMFEGDAYGLFEYGKLSDLNDINGEELYCHYKNIIEKAPLIIFISGDINERKFIDKFECLLKTEKQDISYGDIYRKNLKAPKITEENANIVQGKFALGFKTDITPNSREYYSLSLFNSIFGSGPHSKLFLNVREKMSLCYYVYSRLDRFKGIMTVGIGTDKENFKKAYDEILNQLNKCKNGEISEDEIDFAKKYIISILKQAGDNIYGIAEFSLTGILAKAPIETEEYIEIIENLTLEDMINAAKNIKLQTEYYLS